MDSTAWIATAMIVIAVLAGSAAIYLGFDVERATRPTRHKRKGRR